MYEHEGRYAEAQATQKRALSLVEGAPDSDQIVVSEAIEDLGNAAYGEGRYGEAEDYYKRALAIREKGSDPISQRAVSQTLNLIANVDMRTGRFSDAEPLLKRAIAIQEKVAGHSHPDVAKSLTNLAELYRLTGRYAQSEPLQRRALEIQEKSLGPDLGQCCGALVGAGAARWHFFQHEPEWPFQSSGGLGGYFYGQHVGHRRAAGNDGEC